VNRLNLQLALGIGMLLACACKPAGFICPVTTANGQNPPGENPSELFFGDGQLTTVLWPEGTLTFVDGGPGEIGPDGTLSMKFPWWRGEGVHGKLSITGRRLDGDAPPLRASVPEGYGETGFQASGVIFSGPGCWEVTARAGEATLTFVTLVVHEQ
jgi:hypothetical protein